MKNTEVIIVGSGLAGLSLAWELYFHQCAFVIIAQPHLSHSSIIAPGVWNPIVFKRLNPTWQASTLIQHLQHFYKQIENTIHQPLIQEYHILHALQNDKDKQYWQEKQERYPCYLQDIKTLHKTKYPLLKKDLLCGTVLQAGRLNTSAFIHYSLHFFNSIHAYFEQTFHHDRVQIYGDFIEYNGLKAKHLVFCEGYKVLQNPYFQFITLKPAKGEILHIQTPISVLPENTILHKHISIIPIHTHQYLIGSNYDWTNIHEQPTTAMRKKFLNAFCELFDVPFEILGHYAGIRPAADRRPIIGHHPVFRNLWIFNGLGTKGVMLAPYSAKQLVQAILYHTEIESEMNVNRFLKT